MDRQIDRQTDGLTAKQSPDSGKPEIYEGGGLVGKTLRKSAIFNTREKQKQKKQSDCK